MNTIMNRPKLSQAAVAQKPKAATVSVSRQPQTTPVSSPRPIHDIPCRGTVTAVAPTHDEIAWLAYQIYIENGRPQCQSEQVWQQAEQELRGRAFISSLSNPFK